MVNLLLRESLDVPPVFYFWGAKLLAIPAIIAIIVIAKLIARLMNYFSDLNEGRHQIAQWRRDDEARHSRRRPVLYLRSFSSDGTRETEERLDIHKANKYRLFDDEITIRKRHYNREELILAPFFELGDVVALAPKNRHSKDFGATRLVTDDAEWQNKAMALMRRSILIVFRVDGDFYGSLLWEFNAVLKDHLAKTVFYFDGVGPETIRQVTKLFTKAKLKMPKYDEIAERPFLHYDKSGSYHLVADGSGCLVYQDRTEPVAETPEELLEELFRAHFSQDKEPMPRGRLHRRRPF
jgi:hypothetical protein